MPSFSSALTMEKLNRSKFRLYSLNHRDANHSDRLRDLASQNHGPVLGDLLPEPEKPAQNLGQIFAKLQGDSPPVSLVSCEQNIIKLLKLLYFSIEIFRNSENYYISIVKCLEILKFLKNRRKVIYQILHVALDGIVGEPPGACYK